MDPDPTISPDGPPSHPTPAPSARLGVLFVHGIGDHKEGETLSSFGEPLVDWMGEWLFGKGHEVRGKLRWTEARVRAAGNDK